MTQPLAQNVGKYRLVRKLAVGGMAEVYLAQAAGPAGFTKTLVLKRILPHLAEDQQFVDMFLDKEARLAASLNHPNIVSIFDLGEAAGSYFIAMEFIDGPNLRTLCRRAMESGRWIPFEQAAKIIAAACEGLHYAHEFSENGEPFNLIHRDISPDNILLSRQGAVKVVDFGIAKAANQGHLTKTGTLKGKLAYMPPEQLRGKPLDRRADIFALGVVLYELLSGLKPFDATSEVATMQAILYEPPTPILTRRPDCPEELAQIVDKALAKDREARYPDCRSFQKDLEQFLMHQGVAVGAFELSGLVADMVPPTPVAPQHTPLPSSVPEEISLSGVESIDPPTQAASRKGRTGPVNKPNLPLENTPRPQRVSPPATLLEEELLSTQQNVRKPDLEPATMIRSNRGQVPASSNSGLYAVAAAILLVGGAGGFLALRAPTAPAPVAQVEPVKVEAPPPKPVEIPKPVEPPPPAVEAPVAKAPEPVKTEPAPVTPEPVKTEPVNTEPAKKPAATKDDKKEKARQAKLDEALRNAQNDSERVAPPAPKVAAAATVLIIEVDPPSQVSVDGRALGNSPVELKDATPGQHDVVITNKEKGLNRRLAVAVSAGETKHEKVKFGTGVLQFRVRPYGIVEVDGKVYGQTPIPEGVKVFEGEHRIKISNPELKKEITKTVWVESGKEQVVKGNFEE